MTSIPSNSNIDLEMRRVTDALAKPRLKREDRLVLLRRQAALGDLRDAAMTKARRSGKR